MSASFIARGSAVRPLVTLDLRLHERAKLLYGDTLRSLWSGMGRMGWAWSGVNVIGYSLPDDDVYTRQVLWELSSGYELALTDPDWRIHDVNRTVVVDLQPEPTGQSRLLERYRFLAEELTDFVFSGFGEIALAHMFPDEPHGYRKSHEDSAP
jgi:hypothetical protein